MKFEIFLGVVLPREDPKKRGRYYVYIPELQFNDKTTDPPVNNKYSGIWCFNTIGNNFIRYTELELRPYKDDNSFGTYHPLRPGTQVLVALPVFENDGKSNVMWDSGYIISVLTYETPPNEDRDMFHLLNKADDDSWVFYNQKDQHYCWCIDETTMRQVNGPETSQLAQASGTSFTLDNESITLYVSLTDENEASPADAKPGYYIKINRDEIVIKVGQGGEKSFIKIAPGSIQMKATTINIQADNSLSLEASHVHINDGIKVGADPEDLQHVADSSKDYIKQITDKDHKLHTILKNGEIQDK